MIVLREANMEDMAHAASIMVTSFRRAFARFLSSAAICTPYKNNPLQKQGVEKDIICPGIPW